MLKKLLVLVSGLIFSLASNGQPGFSLKLETGYINFHRILVDVDPTPEWKGHYLENKPDGIDVNLFGGLRPLKGLFIGAGAGYVNFQGIDGLTITSDIDYEFLPSKTITPLINAKVGYNHIWNQYEGGTGDLFVEFGVGGSYQVNGKMSVYLRSGIMVVQNASLFPVRLGIQF